MGIRQFNVVEVGDVVEERGVPEPLSMTVIKVERGMIRANWFVGAKLHVGEFNSTDLTIVRKKPRD